MFVISHETVISIAHDQSFKHSSGTIFYFQSITTIHRSTPHLTVLTTREEEKNHPRRIHNPRNTASHSAAITHSLTGAPYTACSSGQSIFALLRVSLAVESLALAAVLVILAIKTSESRSCGRGVSGGRNFCNFSRTPRDIKIEEVLFFSFLSLPEDERCD